jgi:Arm DNA-binding domain
MARQIERLSALKIERLKKPGMHADGGGLYLRVTPEGVKNWVLRYMLDRRPRWMGLGPLAHTAFRKPARGPWTREGNGMRE